ncbi:MAG: hypothetical protein Q7S77_00525 [Candidatus Staskawiczbacteria bacterium]|nr:hypothetical protein [Candidatus Staskawiczbacteria bacterium]
MNIHDIYISKIVKEKLHGELLESHEIKGGHSGFVYIIDVDLGSKIKKFIVKLSKKIGADFLQLERPEQRVYGGRSVSFKSSFDLLINSNIKTFKLLSCGLPTEDIPYFHQLISKLEGYSLREYLVLDNYPNREDLLRLSGMEFGKLNQITRSYDGWANQKDPYLTKWKNSFFLALEIRLDHLINNKYLSKEEIKKINIFILNKKKKWTDPKEYVFSHVDGIQGMVDYIDSEWVFNGHIDLEDYRFTDQRFVLAGLEIGANYSIDSISNSFWDGYLKFKKVDKSFNDLKDLFKLYYFMSWIQMTDEGLNNIKLSSKINKNYINKIIAIISK